MRRRFEPDCSLSLPINECAIACRLSAQPKVDLNRIWLLKAASRHDAASQAHRGRVPRLLVRFGRKRGYVAGAKNPDRSRLDGLFQTIRPEVGKAGRISATGPAKSTVLTLVDSENSTRPVSRPRPRFRSTWQCTDEEVDANGSACHRTTRTFGRKFLSRPKPASVTLVLPRSRRDRLLRLRSSRTPASVIFVSLRSSQSSLSR